MRGDVASTTLAPHGAPIPCAVCTILIGDGYYEDRVYRDPATGWRVCGACLASLKRQRERGIDRPHPTER
jgi:hypothetical protein